MGVVTNGAGNETRTRDLLFTRQLLYQLSYAGNRLYDTTQADQRQPCYDANGYTGFLLGIDTVCTTNQSNSTQVLIACLA